MLKGTRVLLGKEANVFNDTIAIFRRILLSANYQEVIVPSIWGQETFAESSIDRMWTFKDKADRGCCLIPEVTAVIREIYNDTWKNNIPKPVNVFYVSRCYRYDRPQLGRYREFTQIGVESLGDNGDDTSSIILLKSCLDYFKLKYDFVPYVQRGLSYYIKDGFEVECQSLGAQKQVAGGGRYAEGIGWAVGVERLILALENQNST